MDLAHAAAAGGAPAGTTVVADVQTAGRGRNGRRWVSDARTGVWATVVERPTDLAALPVLSLRVGLALADALDALHRTMADAAGSRTPLALKWPNDLLLGGRKLAGVLVEARWREGVPEWVAVGVGVNCSIPADLPEAAALGAAVRRADVLKAVIASVRTAARAGGALSTDELARYAARDAVRGRRVVEPVVGIAAGVDPGGALLVRDVAGELRPVPTASLRYAPEDEARPATNV